MTQEGMKPRVVTSIALSHVEHQQLKEIASEQQRTVSAQIRYWISQAHETAEAA